MSFWSFRRRHREKKAQDESSRLNALCGKPVSYVCLRNSEGERVIGKSGFLNFADSRIIISCEGKVIFNKPAEEIVLGELMSKNGVTFTYKCADTCRNVTVIAYYSYYRK